MRHLRRAGALALALALAACGPADSGEGLPAEEAALPELPGGYAFRLDSERSDPGEFLVREAQDPDAHLRVTTGPAGIAWNASDRVDRGDFRARATFLQHGAPVGYREAYGIFVGGRDLEGPDQEYTYLLVRGTGDILVKRRLGETTETILDWTPHPSVIRVEAEGDTPRNALAVEVEGEETRFLVNGTTVHRMPTPEARPLGIAGLRVNHRLDVTVEEWVVEALAEDPAAES